MLAAAMNPCPCGYYGSPLKKCTCTQKQIQNYMSKISGPLLERFDLHIDVDPLPYEELAAKEKPESSAVIRERVEYARKLQSERYAGLGFYNNASMPDSMLEEFCPMEDDAESMFGKMYEYYHMSARTGIRIKKVARTSADLDGSKNIRCKDISVAVQFRGFQSKYLK